MNREETAATKVADVEMTITRTFDMPRERLFKLWIEPELMAQWWGPHGFANPVCNLDPRPGGAMYIVMRGPDNVDYPMSGVFREISEPERLVFVAVAEDVDGKPLLESLTTVTFADEGSGTRLTVEARAFGLAPVAAEMLKGMQEGWTQSLERLADLATHSRITEGK